MRSRIVGEADVAPDQLLANPLNWRLHPKEQREALAGVLDEVGWVQRIIVNRTTGHVVDGHARVELALQRSEATVPVLYVELSEAEERLVLASLDPIGGLAATDAARLEELLAGVEATDPALQALLADLARGIGVVGEGELPELPDGDREPFQQMTFTVHDEQKEQIDRALAAAKRLGPFDGPNENSNGNALARVCETFLSRVGDE
jgi:ParB-like chromosome segregation protein Spo0J